MRREERRCPGGLCSAEPCYHFAHLNHLVLTCQKVKDVVHWSKLMLGPGSLGCCLPGPI